MDRQLILAQEAPWNDCASLPRRVGRAAYNVRVQRVLADAEFDSERNHTFVRHELNAESIIPAQRRSSRPASGVRALMRTQFPRRRYCRRSLIESVFSTTKRKLSCRAPGHSLHTQTRQALLLGLTYNLYRLKPSPYLAAGCQQSQIASSGYGGVFLSAAGIPEFVQIAA